MPTANPLEQLRRRMQQHATPAAFAALAEEHRRAGRFDEAIAVCRDGLARYPTYVSARVTLGRALLDSGDVGTAVTELEQAVAQAPDNLAAARTLEAAQAALGEDGVLAPEPSDLPLHPREGRSDIVTPAGLGPLATGPDGPQEFGLGPDWSVPGDPTPDPASSADAPGAPLGQDARAEVEGPETQAIFAHADAPTMYFGPQHLQGEEPAGVWPVPILWDEPAASADQGRSTAPEGSLSVANALTIEAPLVETSAASYWSDPESTQPEPPVESSASVVEWAPEAVVEEASAPEAAVVATGRLDACEAKEVSEAGAVEIALEALPSADDASPFWTGLFGGEPEHGASPPFADWAEGAPSAAPDAASGPWSEDATAEPGGGWGEPDGPPAAWALAEDTGADATPFRWDADTGADADGVAEAFSAPDAPDPLWPDVEASTATDAAWAGSVESALGEVFAQAGQAESAPAAQESPALSTAMAEAAVDAAREDATGPDEEAPAAALESLQRLLESVRARRAALLDDLRH